MASANVDLARSLYAAWEPRDHSATEWAHPEIEFVIADGAAPGTWTGPPGAVEGWCDFVEPVRRRREPRPVGLPMHLGMQNVRVDVEVGGVGGAQKVATDRDPPTPWPGRMCRSVECS